MLEMYDFGPEISHKLMNLTDNFRSSSIYNILMNNMPSCAVYSNFGALGMPRHIQIPPKIKVLRVSDLSYIVKVSDLESLAT